MRHQPGYAQRRPEPRQGGSVPLKRHHTSHPTEAEVTLGKLATATALAVQREGFAVVVRRLRGRPNITEGVDQVPHKASRLLQHLRRKGASVWTKTLPWGAERCDEAVRQGSHKSAHEDREFVFQEMADFCTQGYWAVLPYTVVRDSVNLCVSPLEAVPQRDRRPGLIVDYIFSAVNAETVPLAPAESMQFGRALQRVMARIVQAEQRYGHVHLAKIDIADGFYRVGLQIADIPKLGVVLPTSPGQPALIAFPLTLPMGWVESPPYFTALTETACDLANQSLRERDKRARRMGAHRLEAVAATSPPDAGEPRTGAAIHPVEHRAPQGCPPVAAVDVYVDDFLLTAQTETQKHDVMRASLHAIDAVFEPLSPQDPPHRKEPASVKKMLHGDACCWATTKGILDWDLNTVAGTLHLPPHRLERLHELLDTISPSKKRVSVKTWRKLLGELCSMSPALPGSRGLFSILQAALSKADRNRVRITPQVWHMAGDFRAIATTLGTRPTRLRELIPAAPAYVGACDACQLARAHALVAYENSTGALSISDLELMALLAHKDVLAQHHPVAERMLWMATDNRAALSWSNKGSATATSARAYLLRLNSLHQRQHRYVATHNHIAGKANTMADDASFLLAHVAPGAQHQLCTDWFAIQSATRSRVSSQRISAASSSGRLWHAFCTSLGVDPEQLPSDPIPLLQIFAQRLRSGSATPSRRPMRSRNVEDILRGVGQAYAGLGSADPRLNPHGKIDFRLASLYQAWSKADPPPSRVKPLPMNLLPQVLSLAQRANCPQALLEARLLTMGVFFLLRPGEYIGKPDDTLDSLFRIRDFALCVGSRAINPCTCSLDDLRATTFASLTFTRQKNGVRGKNIGHGRSGDPLLCPVLCIVELLLALRALHAPSSTPLNVYSPVRPGGPFRYVLSADLTRRIRATLAVYPDASYHPRDVSARSTRAGGAMALLCAGVDRDHIRMIGRWRSDELFRYLHVQTQPIMNGLSAAMLRGGTFRLDAG